MAGALEWQPLGAIRPQDLGDARRKLHRAVQWVARMARSYYPPAEDDSHTALSFHGPSGAAGLPPAAGADGEVIPAFIFPEMAVALSHEAKGLVLGLRGMNELERAEAVRDALATVGLDPARFQTGLPYANEIEAVEDEGPDAAEAVELTRYYANLSACLEELSDRHRCISPVRLWPHHFDVARLIALDDNPAVEDARSIGVGLAPDGGAFDQPYLYVAPWPPSALPASVSLPTPPAGLRWNTAGFTALVAPADTLMLGEQGRARVDAAVDQGVALCRSLLVEMG